MSFRSELSNDFGFIFRAGDGVQRLRLMLSLPFVGIAIGFLWVADLIAGRGVGGK